MQLFRKDDKTVFFIQVRSFLRLGDAKRLKESICRDVGDERIVRINLVPFNAVHMNSRAFWEVRTLRDMYEYVRDSETRPPLPASSATTVEVYLHITGTFGRFHVQAYATEISALATLSCNTEFTACHLESSTLSSCLWAELYRLLPRRRASTVDRQGKKSWH